MTTEVIKTPLSDDEKKEIATIKVGETYNFRGVKYIFTSISREKPEWKTPK